MQDLFAMMEASSTHGWWDWWMSGREVDARSQGFDDGQFEYMSPRFWEILGRDKAKDQIPDHPSSWQKLIHPDDLDAALAAFEAHVKTRGRVPFDLNARYPTPGGEWVTVRCRGEVVKWGDNGEPIRMIGTHTLVVEIESLGEQIKALGVVSA